MDPGGYSATKGNGYQERTSTQFSLNSSDPGSWAGETKAEVQSRKLSQHGVLVCLARGKFLSPGRGATHVPGWWD